MISSFNQEYPKWKDIRLRTASHYLQGLQIAISLLLLLFIVIVWESSLTLTEISQLVRHAARGEGDGERSVRKGGGGG